MIALPKVYSGAGIQSSAWNEQINVLKGDWAVARFQGKDYDVANRDLAAREVFKFTNSLSKLLTVERLDSGNLNVARDIIKGYAVSAVSDPACVLKLLILAECKNEALRAEVISSIAFVYSYTGSADISKLMLAGLVRIVQQPGDLGYKRHTLAVRVLALCLDASIQRNSGDVYTANAMRARANLGLSVIAQIKPTAIARDVLLQTVLSLKCREAMTSIIEDVLGMRAKL